MFQVMCEASFGKEEIRLADGRAIHKGGRKEFCQKLLDVFRTSKMIGASRFISKEERRCFEHVNVFLGVTCILFLGP